MINQRRVVVVLPAYNASRTLERTYREIPFDVVDDVVLVDDYSRDDTSTKARDLGIRHVIRHDRNRGYGGNQKTCYATALSLGADIVVMLHPDYQYTPKLITAMASIIAFDVYPVVLASRILGKGALVGGMPRYKYVANRLLTLMQNILVGQKLSEYHTGYRAFSKDVLQRLNLEANSDDFVFDNQMLSQIIMADIEIGEVTCPTKYFAEASSINLRRSITYGIGVVLTSVQHRLHRWGILRHRRYSDICT
jgi:glycosyltransferase involved in cell wall biosynthesis